MAGLEQIKEGKTKDFNTVCDRLEKKYRAGAIIDMNEMKQLFMAFQWDAVEVNGHDCTQIYDALREATGEKPHAVIAHTVKGKGISFMEGDNSWHDRKISEQELTRAKEEVGLIAES